MYNQYLKVKPSKTGNGVFTSVLIPTNSPIIEVTGNIYAEHELPDPNHPTLLQIGSNVFIGPSGSHDDYINHSCDPNCYLHIVGNRAIVFSLYEITAGTELTFDYSTSSTDSLEKWKMDCQCGSFKCRKVISGLQYLPKDLVDDYNKRGMIPMFMNVSLFMRK